MVTPGRTAPVLSVTVPLMVPVMAPTVWPAPVDACSAKHAINETRRIARRYAFVSALNVEHRCLPGTQSLRCEDVNLRR